MSDTNEVQPVKGLVSNLPPLILIKNEQPHMIFLKWVGWASCIVLAVLLINYLLCEIYHRQLFNDYRLQKEYDKKTAVESRDKDLT